MDFQIERERIGAEHAQTMVIGEGEGRRLGFGAERVQRPGVGDSGGYRVKAGRFGSGT